MVNRPLTLHFDKQLGRWFIRDKRVTEPYGPYDTRKDADEDRIGLERFYAQNPRLSAEEETPATP